MEPEVSVHRASAEELLAGIAAELDGIRQEYAKSVERLAVSSELRIRLLDFFVHNRAVLDYLAQDFLAFCTKKRSRVYFPIASDSQSRAEFLKRLDGKWFPGLAKAHPQLFDYLDSIQHYNGNCWAPAFVKLANRGKHISLVPHVVGSCRAAVLCVHGRPRLQVGDRGYGRVEIQAGGTLRFRDPDARTWDVRGPQVITASTTDLENADSGLTIGQAAWTEFKFEVFPDQPAVVFVEIVERNVKAVAARVMALVP